MKIEDSYGKVSFHATSGKLECGRRKAYGSAYSRANAATLKLYILSIFLPAKKRKLSRCIFHGDSLLEINAPTQNREHFPATLESIFYRSAERRLLFGFAWTYELERQTINGQLYQHVPETVLSVDERFQFISLFYVTR